MEKGVKLSNQLIGTSKSKGILHGIASIVIDLTTINWSNLPKSVLDTIGALKFDDTDEMIAWKLINRSLVSALTTLVYELKSNYEIDYNLVDPLDIELDKFLDKNKYFIDSDFFNNPKKILFLNDVKPILKSFLALFQLHEHEINNILDRLDNYFVHALVVEWRTNNDSYVKLENSLITPFDKADEKQQQWITYRAYLENQIHKPVFSESFSLKQLYIPLRGFYKEKVDKHKQHKNDLDGNDKKIAVDLENYLLNWINTGTQKNAIKILKGGPGYGKSSFLKMLAAKLAGMNRNVLFIPLHLFDLEDKLITSINNYLSQVNIIKHNPFDDDEKLILLFDGLDELSMQGKAILEVVKGFLRELEKSVNAINSTQLKIQAIISGRDVIVQQNETEFREEEQILSLLPYYLTDSIKMDFTDTLGLLEEDQRNSWWTKYGTLKGKYYEGLPEELRNNEVDEITAQPLLNFLIAMSYERGQIDFNDSTNLNTIYNDLLEAVYERGYSDGKKLKTICELKQGHFCLLLEEIALSAWHGTGRTTTVNDIKKHFESNNLIQLLNNFIKDAENGVVALLAAFYFRQAGQNIDGSQTFEFTHKSFGEYLTSRKIIRQLQKIHKYLNENENDIQREAGWNTTKCLEVLVNLFGNKELDVDIIKFIENEFKILIKTEVDSLNGLQKTLVKLIDTMLLHGIPMEKKSPRLPTYKQEDEYAINTEKSIIILLGIVARLTDQVSEINWPNEISFGELVSRINRQRVDYDVLVYKYLNNINLSLCVFHVKDLFRANLEKSIFNGVASELTNFESANLMGADLKASNLREANLQRAILEDASLQGAQLERVNLFYANMKYANCGRALFNEATLQEANLLGANLQDADLREANLKGANLMYANLQNADLSSANLEGANLIGANLLNANLQNANLQDADLSSADFQNATLQNADLRGSNFIEANLNGADIQDAIFEEEKIF